MSTKQGGPARKRIKGHMLDLTGLRKKDVLKLQKQINDYVDGRGYPYLVVYASANTMHSLQL